MPSSPVLRLFVGGFYLFLIAGASSGQSARGDRTSELDDLIAEYETAEGTYRSSPERNPEERPWRTFPSRFLAFAKREYDDASLRCCEFIILKFYIAPERYEAIDIATRHHQDRPEIGSFLASLLHMYDDDPAADRCLDALIASANPRTRLLARYHQARLMIDRRNWCLHGDAQRYDDVFEKNRIAAFQSEQTRRTIVELLREIVAQSPPAPYFGRPLVQWAAQDLHELEHLETGRPAPDIQGRDSQGALFRLSDFRGKVVVVTFWAHWCGACLADLPEEVKFVRKMQGRPMVWLGVNGDQDVSLLRQAETDGKVNFRSWHDGENGPIAARFAVRGWPAMYVIDQEGIIRYKSRICVELPVATRVIESLVSTVERAAEKRGTDR